MQWAGWKLRKILGWQSRDKPPGLHAAQTTSTEPGCPAATPIALPFNPALLPTTYSAYLQREYYATSQHGLVAEEVSTYK